MLFLSVSLMFRPMSAVLVVSPSEPGTHLMSRLMSVMIMPTFKLEYHYFMYESVTHFVTRLTTLYELETVLFVLTSKLKYKSLMLESGTHLVFKLIQLQTNTTFS